MALVSVHWRYWDHRRAQPGGRHPVHLWAGRCHERWCADDCYQGDRAHTDGYWAFTGLERTRITCMFKGVSATAIVIDELAAQQQEAMQQVVAAYQYALYCEVESEPGDRIPLPIIDVDPPCLEGPPAARIPVSGTVVPCARSPPDVAGC